MNNDNLNYKRELISAHQKRLRELELSAAKLGINCPPEIKIEIKTIKDTITDISKSIQDQEINLPHYIDEKKSILVIEDDFHALERCCLILESEGYKVMRASNGAKGLEIIKKKVPDVVILDLHLPDISGSMILMEIVEEQIPTRVIVLSAFINEDNIGSFIKVGACEHLLKPYERSELITTVRRAIGLTPTIDVIRKNPSRMINVLISKIEELTKKGNYFDNKTSYQAEEIEQLAMIGLFFGEDIHMAFNKLGAARHFAKKIQRYLSDQRPEVEWANVIDVNISYVIELMDNIRNTVNLPTPQKIDLYSVLSDAINFSALNSLIQLAWPCEAIDGTVLGLSHQLRQVFRIIIYNASQAIPRGEGTISFCLKDERRDDIDYVLVSVADTGIGIPDSTQPYVFTIGSQPGHVESNKSFSFGLAWARLFLRMYKGDIWYETDKEGTIFYVLIPRIFSQNRLVV